MSQNIYSQFSLETNLEIFGIACIVVTVVLGSTFERSPQNCKQWAMFRYQLTITVSLLDQYSIHLGYLCRWLNLGEVSKVCISPFTQMKQKISVLINFWNITATGCRVLRYVVTWWKKSIHSYVVSDKFHIQFQDHWFKIVRICLFGALPCVLCSLSS